MIKFIKKFYDLILNEGYSGRCCKMNFLFSMLTTVKDVSQEVFSKNSGNILVNSEKALKEQLFELKVDLKDIRDVSTGKNVKNWNEILGVFKNKEGVFAYSKSLESEMDASLKMFSQN